MSQLDELIMQIRAEYVNLTLQEAVDKFKPKLLKLLKEARRDENESLLSVAEHEIELPDHCDMHDKHTAQCYACKKRKWYGEISKDWKRIIEVRLEELSK